MIILDVQTITNVGHYFKLIYTKFFNLIGNIYYYCWFGYNETSNGLVN